MGPDTTSMIGSEASQSPSGPAPALFVIVLASIAGFAAFMAAAFALPLLLHSPTLDDDWTRNTVRVSLVFYALAEGFALARRSARLVRVWWTLGWLGYVIHLWVAFQVYHHGSHAEAVEHVRSAAGVGAGIYVSHVFTLVWTLDVLAQWLAPAWRREWPAAAVMLLHGFMGFIVFCAMVVYETGPIRWSGIALFLAFLLLLLWRGIPRTRAESLA